MFVLTLYSSHAYLFIKAYINRKFLELRITYEVTIYSKVLFGKRCKLCKCSTEHSEH